MHGTRKKKGRQAEEEDDGERELRKCFDVCGRRASWCGGKQWIIIEIPRHSNRKIHLAAGGVSGDGKFPGERIFHLVINFSSIYFAFFMSITS